MFFGIDPRIRQWAETLGTMTFNFRLHYLGMDRDPAISQIRESWHGAEISEVSDEIFIVTNKVRAEPFQFHFMTPRDMDQKVQMILVIAEAPFANVMLAADKKTTNYLIRCAPENLNKQEKQLCEALKKHEGIPQGRVSDS